ncbi:MAG: DUF1203 domain-containing protein [Sedimentitalea sp.]
MSDAQLQKNGTCRVKADAFPGFPCRVSLADAQVGEELILLNFKHLNVTTPYAASHAIYVRSGVDQSKPTVGEVPDVLSRRLLSIRGFGTDGLMKQANVVEGATLSDALKLLFQDAEVSFVDIHNAKQGCFAARAKRA